MNNSLLIPFNYFRVTRLNNREAFLFHGVAEWIPALFILYFFRSASIADSVLTFACGYIVFISVYEIGYFTNDYYAARREENGRKRIQAYTLSPQFPFYFIVVRVMIAVMIAYSYFPFTVSFVAFYAGLAVTFAIHNLLPRNELKIVTFVGLALFRFIGPFYSFVPQPVVVLLIPAVLLHYVFFRSLTYMTSKNLLTLPSRKNLSFKQAYYLILLPVSAFLAYLQNSFIPIIFNLYFLLFWSALIVFNRFASSQDTKN